MPDFDANADLTRLPANGVGRHGRTRRPAGVVLQKRAVAVLRYLDVVLVVLAVPVALALGAPAVGVLVSAAAWLMQRVLAGAGQRWIAGRGVDSRFGLNLVDGFGRIWLLAGAIVIAAVIGGRRDGLAAAVLIFCAYSIAFAIRLVSGRPQGAPQR
jgi:hypothetical protein